MLAKPLVPLLAILVLAAGCTGPDVGPAPTTTTAGTTTSAPAADGLQFRSHASLGEILADPQGRTLYVFTNDDPGVSNCYGTCANNWPPYTSNTVPNAPSEIAAELNLTTRTDGSQQLAYRGRPLYYWIQDDSPGEASGDGVNGIWFVVRKPPANTQTVNGRGTYQVEADNVTYHQNTQGYYAKPQGLTDGAADVGIVMIHEWWGLNDHIRDMARILASHGYQVLAVDLFKGNVATTPQQAQAQVAQLDQQEANANMQAAADHLRQQGALRIASLGWCFGGGQSLQLAMSGEELVATIIYYGFLDTNQQNLSVIDWPVLGIFAENDQAIAVSTVRAFERALNNESIENDIYIYPDVGHAFANPSGGNAWAPEETKDAWLRTLAFLRSHAVPGTMANQ